MLRPLCISGLRGALDPATGVYNRQLRDKQWKATRGTEDITSTAACLIGVARAHIDPNSLGLDPIRTLKALIKTAQSRQYEGSLGLVVWANAVWDGEQLERLLHQLGTSSQTIAAASSAMTTMEVAWLLSGLAHEVSRSREPDLDDVIESVARELQSRFRANTNLFCHATSAAPWRHRARRWIANFADQIYPIYAFSAAAMSTGKRRGIDLANACAAQLAALQGERGQWWWQYAVRRGKVAQAYPVYSVHQHGMAPMAFTALARAGGDLFEESVALGREWLSNNELGIKLVDQEAATIWRDIRHNAAWPSRVSRQVCSLVGFNSTRNESRTQKLKVNYETRPYEWAWCLYAEALTTEGSRSEFL